MKLDYPIKFDPILKSKIWGGDLLMKKFNKVSDRKDIGESWEISDVPNDTSVVSNGALKGNSLKELMKTYTSDLLGKHVFDNFGLDFPLLIKFIDAKEALSIQLHPNDELARERHNSFGKTEMWYVMDSAEDGNLVVGFKKDSNQQEYLTHLKNGTLMEILNVDKVKPGDVYFIPTGRIHAIGAGVVLAEIQQTSDITYRIFDWNRTDDQGNSRELHTDLALDAIDYNAEDNYFIDYAKEPEKNVNIVDCQYFTTNLISITDRINIDHSKKDSFVIYICVKGEVNLHFGNDKKELLSSGESVLLPACLNKISLVSKEETELLEVYIKQK